MSKVPFNKSCRTCPHLIFDNDEDNITTIKIFCNPCEKFGICNKCCRSCPDRYRSFNYETYGSAGTLPDPIPNNYTYTVTYTNNSSTL